MEPTLPVPTLTVPTLPVPVAVAVSELWTVTELVAMTLWRLVRVEIVETVAVAVETTAVSPLIELGVKVT